jgi:hypothetical protein
MRSKERFNSRQILAVAALGSLGLSMAAHAQTAVTENTTVGGRAFIDLTTDFNDSSSTGETQVFIKKAYVQARIADALAVRAGSADLPWMPYSEGV